MAVTVGHWRWYSNATPDGSMVPLAAEDTAPTLTAAQIERGIIRLRVQLVGDATGGTVSVAAREGVDGANWKGWGSGPSIGTNEWVRWANGAATASATIGSQLLTGTTASGKYHEASAVSEIVPANGRLEIDLAMMVIWTGPGITVLHQLLNTATLISFDPGIPTISYVAPGIGVRQYALDLAGTNTSAGQIREMDFSQWPRIFYSQSGYHWFFAPRPQLDGSSVMTYWRWDGSGGTTGTWTRATVTLTGTITTTSDGDIRHAPAQARLGSTDVFTVVSRPSSGNLRYIRGREASGTITWGSNTDLGMSAGSPIDRIHCAVDDGGYHWLAASATTSPQVWAVWTQTADDGSSGYTPDFGTISIRRVTLTETITAATPVTVVPIGTQQALVFWYANPNLRCAKVTTAGFGTPVTVNSTAQSHQYDWGVTRAGNFVYVAYRDGTTASDAPWVLRVYSISGDSWATGPGSVPKATQNSNNDGLVCTYDPVSDNLYVIGSAIGPEGNQDRPLQYVCYTGPGSAGAWNTSITSGQTAGLSGAVAGTGMLAPPLRANGDDISGARQAGGGKIVLAYLYGDNDVNGHPFTYEYHTLATATGTDSKNFPDTAAATDSLTVSQGNAAKTLTDSGLAGESLSVDQPAKTLTDTAVATETVSVAKPGGQVLGRWTGSAIVPQRLDRWTGSALVEVQISKL